MPLWAAVDCFSEGLKRGGSGAADGYASPIIFWVRIAGKRPLGSGVGQEDRTASGSEGVCHDREGRDYLRFSPHYYNTEAELEHTIAAL